MHCEKVDFLLFYVLIYFLLYFILCDGNVIDSLLSWYKNYMIYIYIYIEVNFSALYCILCKFHQKSNINKTFKKKDKN